MEAGKRTITDIFNGARALEIPFYQRSYVWGKEQWERLLEDVETVSKSHEPYFLGSVILKQQPTGVSKSIGDVRTVVDGQQRLTTLCILLKVLCLKNNRMQVFDKRFRLDDNTVALKHNRNDLEAFNTVMNLTALDVIEKNDKITQAYAYFKENLNLENLGEEAFQIITQLSQLVLGYKALLSGHRVSPNC